MSVHDLTSATAKSIEIIRNSNICIKRKMLMLTILKGKKKSDRVLQEQRDPVSILKRFDLLDDMDVLSPQNTGSKSCSPKKKDRDLSLISHPN